MSFDELRKKYPTFVFESFEGSYIDGKLKVEFHFLIEPDIKFTPTIIFPNVTQERLGQVGEDVLNNLILNLGMVELISYWKATCSPDIIIKAGFLNNDQLAWWKDLLINGLGQFFFENKIDFTRSDLVNFNVEYFDLTTPVFVDELQDRDLVLVSGGKDSAVSLETVKKVGKEIGALFLNPNQSAKDVAETAGVKEHITIERNIDKKLLELNSQGFLNGHTPFSAYLGFLSILTQVIYNYRSGIIADEESSNEGNVSYLGKEINHQYSKSFEYEQKFNTYKNTYLSTSTRYFSVLRPLKDIQIVKIFSYLAQYHQLFRSCNVGSKSNIWCGNCPKCLYTYLALYPFLGKTTQEIFGKDLLSDLNLVSLTKGLLGSGDLKPFECVGTFEENKILVAMSIQKYSQEGLPLPPVLKEVESEVSHVTPESIAQIFKFWNDKNDLPIEYQDALKQNL